MSRFGVYPVKENAMTEQELYKLLWEAAQPMLRERAMCSEVEAVERELKLNPIELPESLRDPKKLARQWLVLNVQ
jgi:hypothetical protein